MCKTEIEITLSYARKLLRHIHQGHHEDVVVVNEDDSIEHIFGLFDK